MVDMTIAEGKFAELRVRFQERLPARLSVIAQALDHAREDADANTAAELRRHFHSLAGTSGTYGMTALAGIAHLAETVCERHLDAAAFENLECLLTEIKARTSGQAVA